MAEMVVVNRVVVIVASAEEGAGGLGASLAARTRKGL